MLGKVLKGVAGLVVLVLIAVGGRMLWMGKKSANVKNSLGMEQGHLKECGTKPNCVSSSAENGSEYYIEPFRADNIEGLWDDLNILLPEMGFEIVTGDSRYLHATATTRIFGFVDDMEFLLDRENGVIEVRSLSRVGYSDLGANRKRIESIRDRLLP